LAWEVIVLHICLIGCLLVGAAASAEDAAVSVARAAVAERSSAPESSIHLVDVEATQWGDTSLGCREKGRMYAQMVVRGYRVRLRVEDRTFDVRVAGRRAVICDRAAQEGEDGAAATTRLYRQARQDLAERLGIPETEIEVRFIRPKVWPDDSLGCPGATREDAPPTRVRGYLIALDAGERTYEYHTDMQRVVYCER
jgi:hypothetical protein